MNTVSAQISYGRGAPIVRLGGLAGLFNLGLFIIINFLLSEAPPGNLEEIKAYIANQASAMAIANGLRNLALFSTAFVAVGLYTLTTRGTPLAGNGWGLLGLLGAGALMATGVMANGVQTLAFLNFADFANQPELFMLLWNLSRILFNVAQLFTAIHMAGFNIAGWQSRAIPTWLVVVGVLAAALTLLNVVFIAWAMTGGVASHLFRARILAFVWFVCVSIHMLRRAST